MKDNVNKNNQCVGCGICELVCPKGIIKIELNNEGFYSYKIINEDSCIECGECIKYCVVNNTYKKSEVINSYSVWSNNENIRQECSSGGVAFEIANLLYQKGYKLCGVEYDKENKMAKHILVDNIKDYEKCKGSKYMQSYTIDAFSKILSQENGKFAIFGTPCQIASIKKVLYNRKRLNDVLLIDFFCHGVPSYFLWKDYLNYIKTEQSIDEIDEVKFRDKSEGWHEFTMSIIGKNGKKYCRSLSQKDWYMRFFLSNMCLNDSCYNCKFRIDTCEADIRIGDLWGGKYKENTHGVSGVLTFTNNGEDIIKKLKNVCTIKIEPIDVVTEEQVRKDMFKPIFRKKIIKDLRKNKKLSKIYRSRVLISKIHRKLWEKK